MAKWHVNPETGRVGRCRAHVRACQFGATAHFRSEAEAYEGALALSPELQDLAKEAMKAHRKQSIALADHAEASLQHREAELDSNMPHQQRLAMIAMGMDGRRLGGPSPMHVLKIMSAGRPSLMATALAGTAVGAAVKYFSPEAEANWRNLEKLRALSRARRHGARYEAQAQKLREATGVSPEAQAEAHFEES